MSYIAKTYKLKPPFFFILISFFVFFIGAYAQADDEFDSYFFEGLNELTKSNWDFFGFVQSLNQFSLSSTDDSNYDVVKLESRIRLNAKYAFDYCYVNASLDGYFYPERQAEENSHYNDKRIDANELYLGGGKKLQFRIGKQLFLWGKGDVFQITNYLDQPDMRNFITIDTDDKYRGVFAFSIKSIINDLAVEAAVTPIHNPILMPEGFWEINLDQSDPLEKKINEVEAKPLSLKNSSFALRGGGHTGFFDFHLSYYHGFNNNIIYKPELELITPGPPPEVLINLNPYFKKINTIGSEIAFEVNRFTFRSEGAFTFDMPAVSRINKEMIYDFPEEIGSVEKVPYGALVLSGDVTYGANGRILIEGMYSRYLKNRDKYEKILFTDLLLIKVEDKFFHEYIYAELGTMMRTVQRKPGLAIIYELGYDFKNGLTISAGGYLFCGSDDDLFEIYKDSDIAFLKARMAF